MGRFIKVVGIVLIIIFLLMAALIFYLSRRPAVAADYHEKITSGGIIEEKYLARGKYEVAYFEQSVLENYKKYEVWYPSELETSEKRYPVVVINNGTGIPASKCKALFEHLASWGFIVIGNEEENSWNGFAADMSLNYLLKANENSESIFFGHVDTDKIGVSGHSQGGVAVINTITATRHAGKYQAAYAASVTHEELSFLLEWEYDASEITIPFFMTAGTKDMDAKTISPLEGMNQIYDKITGAPIKVMARRTDADHGEMLTGANGYETAWFMWLLQGDEEAGLAFGGASPEICNNSCYQDQRLDYN